MRRARSARLEDHAAGVQPETGHWEADLVPDGEGVGVSAGIDLAEQERPREQEAAGEPVSFLFLFGIAGNKCVAG